MRLKLKHQRTWSFYQSAESVLASTEAQLKAAEIANEGITLEYDSGNTRTTLEVIQSRSLLLEARISNAEAKKDFIISKLKLLSQVGRLELKSFKTLKYKKNYIFYLLDKKNKMCTFILTIRTIKKDIK